MSYVGSTRLGLEAARAGPRFNNTYRSMFF